MNTKGVEDGMSDEGQWLVSAKVIHPDYLKQIEHELWQIGGAFAEIKVENKPAVPVEERTQWVRQRMLAKCDCWKYSQQVCEVCQGVGGPDKAPIPEERTAEMEHGMKEIRSNLAAIYDATIEQDHGIAILAERCLKLLDHIEGKGPCAK